MRPLHGDNLSFFVKDTATTEIYTLSLHDALPIWSVSRRLARSQPRSVGKLEMASPPPSTRRHRSSGEDRKSTRLNSSHPSISYAVFCLKKKTRPRTQPHRGRFSFQFPASSYL